MEQDRCQDRGYRPIEYSIMWYRETVTFKCWEGVSANLARTLPQHFNETAIEIPLVYTRLIPKQSKMCGGCPR